MTGADFRDLMKEAGFSQVGLAADLSRQSGQSINDRTVRRWCSGQARPQAGAVAYLRLLVELKRQQEIRETEEKLASLKKACQS